MKKIATSGRLTHLNKRLLGMKTTCLKEKEKKKSGGVE